MPKLDGEHGKHYTSKTLTWQHCHWEHDSMQMFAFSSKPYCASNSLIESYFFVSFVYGMFSVVSNNVVQLCPLLSLLTFSHLRIFPHLSVFIIQKHFSYNLMLLLGEFQGDLSRDHRLMKITFWLILVHLPLMFIYVHSPC